MSLLWNKPDREAAKRWVAEGKKVLDHQQKLACFDKAIRADPDYAPAWSNKGYVLLSLKNYEEALKCCSKAVEIRPDYRYAWNARGDALRNLGRYVEAIKSYKKAISLKNDYAYPWNGMGDALRELGQYSQAIKCYDSALKIRPLSMSWNGKGVALAKMGKSEDALYCFDRSISISPTFVWPWYCKGRLLEKLGRVQESARCYRTVLKIDPEFQDANDRLNRISRDTPTTASGKGERSTLVRQSLPPATSDFQQELENLFSRALEDRRTSIKVNAGELHRTVGGYPRSNHRMHLCCKAMYREMQEGDLLLHAPAKGEGASLTILYQLPRPEKKAASSPRVFQAVEMQKLPASLASRYTESEVIGQGGFARVFCVTKRDGSIAAVKVPIALEPSTGKAFMAEIQNWMHLKHRNIVRIIDYNILPIPFIEMEYCGGSLAEMKKPVSPEEAAMMVINICEGLKYAHARSIIHLDLKPQNILLDNGVPKITDWGLSRLISGASHSVSPLFTVFYAAPEQINGDISDQRTDIWQIGVILYELVTGRLPFTGDSMVEIGMGIATKVPERPGAVNPDAQPLDGIILKCLEKDSARRYQSVADLQKDLAAYLKISYLGSLKDSIQLNDLSRSAYYCGDLVLISMKIGDLAAAYKYSLDLIRYSRGDVRAEAQELSDQIRSRVEMKAGDLPVELIQKAEVIVHRVRLQ